MWYRHTGQWFLLHRSVPLEDALRLIESEEMLQPRLHSLVCDAWAVFSEVQAVAVIGSVAKALRKEIPRFRDFRREGIEVWHECADLDLALWIDFATPAR